MSRLSMTDQRRLGGERHKDQNHTTVVMGGDKAARYQPAMREHSSRRSSMSLFRTPKREDKMSTRLIRRLSASKDPQAESLIEAILSCTRQCRML